MVKTNEMRESKLGPYTGTTRGLCCVLKSYQAALIVTKSIGRLLWTR